MHCSRCGNEMRRIGLELGDACECPLDGTVQIAAPATRPGEQAVMPAIFVFPDRLSAAGAIPSPFQQTLLFGGDTQ